MNTRDEQLNNALFQVSEKTQQIECLKTEIQRIQKEFELLLTQKTHCDQSLAQSENQNDELLKKNLSLKKENSELNHKTNELCMQLTQKEDMEQAYNYTISQIDELTNENEALRSELVDRTHKVEELTKELSLQKKEQSEGIKEIEQHRKMSADIQKDYDDMCALLSQHQKKIEALTTEISKKNTELDNLRFINSDLEENVKVLAEHLEKSMIGKDNEQQKLQQDIEKLRMQLKDSQAQCEDLNQELTNHVNEFYMKLEEKEHEIKQKTNELESLKYLQSTKSVED